jgi:sigma-B regulation protein RsbU (phosphoserine phosphatase)
MVALEKIRNALLERREPLVTSINLAPSNTKLGELLKQVDAALDRISSGTYGVCEICKQPIEGDRLHVDPLVRSCLSHLGPEELVRIMGEQRIAFGYLGDIKEDVTSILPEARRPGRILRPRHSRSLGRRLVESLRAARRTFEDCGTVDQNPIPTKIMEQYSRARVFQSLLLPEPGFGVAEWETYYDYEPAGAVGGDYCDLVAVDGELYFLLGDAVGKGIAASMIASQLYSLFRALLPQELPLNKLFERINRIFCESWVAGYYATLVCGRASCDGAIELVNAGHLPPLMLRSGQAIPLAATGLPLGLFYTSAYDVTELRLVSGETLLFYTDGITEARNRLDVEYGPERLMSLAIARSERCPKELVRACVDDVTTFTAGIPLLDDRTVMALRHAPPSAMS